VLCKRGPAGLRHGPSGRPKGRDAPRARGRLVRWRRMTGSVSGVIPPASGFSFFRRRSRIAGGGTHTDRAATHALPPRPGRDPGGPDAVFPGSCPISGAAAGPERAGERGPSPGAPICPGRSAACPSELTMPFGERAQVSSDARAIVNRKRNWTGARGSREKTDSRRGMPGAGLCAVRMQRNYSRDPGFPRVGLCGEADRGRRGPTAAPSLWGPC
jgi:hypothetical protein